MHHAHTGEPPTPTFSILTAAYNAATTIGATVASVLAQDRSDWELIVVDDGSADETAAAAERIAAGDPRVKVIRQANAGCGAARNNAATHARGDLLCILDSDDAYEPNYLSSMWSVIERYPDRELYSCNGHYLYPGDVRVPVWRGSSYSREQEYTVEQQLDRNRIFIMAIVRREAFERVGGFRVITAEDYDLWMRVMMTGGRHIFNPAFIGIYRISPGSLASVRDKMEHGRLRILGDLLETAPVEYHAAIERAIGRQHGRVEVAEMERRLVEGDSSGARRVFWRNVRSLPTAARRVIGLAAITVSPRMYRAIFLRRMRSTTGTGRAS